jgi:biotin transport system substrate-specific component
MSVLQVSLIDRVVPRSRVTDLVLISAGAGLTALLAQIQIPMYPVPMTLQTFAVLLIAASMGPWRALSSMGLYVAMGAAGVPVFAGAKALSQVLPTAGYLVGFAVAAVIVGLLANRGFVRQPVAVLLSFLAGSAIIYLFGASWLVLGLGMDVQQALLAGVIPFLVGDAAKALLAAAVLPTAWKFTK